MKRGVVGVSFCLSILMILSGCGLLIDWGRETFYQGEELKNPTAKVKDYLRTVRVYDQVSTVGAFDVLWLSDFVRTVYADLHAMTRGKLAEQKEAFLRRQLQETEHYISFYVLSWYRIPLGTPNACWHMFLCIDGKHYFPIEVKEVGLTCEYVKLFADRFNQFKTPYIVRFDARDIDGNLLITNQTDQITIYFRTMEKEVSVAWQLDDQGNAIPVPKKCLAMAKEVGRCAQDDVLKQDEEEEDEGRCRCGS